MIRLTSRGAVALAWIAFTLVVALPGSSTGAPPKNRVLFNGVPDTGQFLLDSDVLAKVGERTVTVRQFREGYFAIYPTMRPRPDSLGRVEFLQNIVRKEILGQVAMKVNRPFTFEDRAQLREYSDRLLGNILYMHEVDDSLDLSEPTLRAVYAFYDTELRVRHLFFTDRSVAESVRMRLLRGQLAWGAATATYGLRDTTGRLVNTEQQWLRFETLPPDIGMQMWSLKLGEFSPLLLTPGGYHLVQVVEIRKRAQKPPFEGLRGPIEIVLRQVQTRRLRARLQEEAMVGFDVQFDSVTIRNTSKKFTQSMKLVNDGFATELTVDASVPEFNLDEQRAIIARWNKGRDSLTVEGVVHAYTDLPLLGRPSLNTPEDMQQFCLNIVLEPRLVQVADRRGLRADSTYRVLVARKDEEIRVTHMVEDSVFSRVVLTEADRRKYYQDHLEDYRTFPSVRYALLVAPNKAIADSVKLVLDKGRAPETVVAEFKQKFGDGSAKIDVETQNEPTFVHKNLFEELKPGKSTVNGPDKLKQYFTVRSISRDEGRILSFEEAEHYVDESLQNVRMEAALGEFVERHRSRFAIETHPEKVMKIKLQDLAGD